MVDSGELPSWTLETVPVVPEAATGPATPLPVPEGLATVFVEVRYLGGGLALAFESELDGVGLFDRI